uniref:Prenyl transferase n=1 Tax=Rhodymenia pseudopalmata TaxID=31502 RepID=A0A1C9C7E9_RHOPU|nr:prenyl transferase [Rhodymenia pseudopalmata]AOM64299.1 prenyl transferase [Rhodymenia pseudopalmata]
MILYNKLLSSIQYDLEILNKNLKKMVGPKHPILYAAAEHLFNAKSKRIRPAIVLLAAQVSMQETSVLSEHRRLAEITEIIHTASLVHDDVVDDCQTRRGVETVHSTFNTKVAILAGDFLFAQASWYLANLNNLEVVKAISKVITDFAEGEVRQGLNYFNSFISIDDYIEKSFYKTASLIAASCKGAAMISNANKEIQENFYLYGKHLGLAFQITDDILDITGSKDSLGKPAGSDLKNGNFTAPLIFALQEKKELYEYINREFKNKEDVNEAIEIIKNSQAIQKAKDLAREHIQASLQALKKQHECEAKKILESISISILYRLS